MALNNLYKEVKKNKVKKDIYMPLDEFLKEHRKLIPILRNGSKEEQQKEADDQAKEVEDETGIKI